MGMLIVATAAAEQHRISSTTQFIQSRWMSECCEIIFCCWICALKAVLVTIVYWTLLLDSEALKLLHRHRIGRLFWPILSTIGFLHYRPNPSFVISFSALTLLVGRQEGLRPVESRLLVCWWWFDCSFARHIAPVVTTTSVIPAAK